MSLGGALQTIEDNRMMSTGSGSADRRFSFGGTTGSRASITLGSGVVMGARASSIARGSGTRVPTYFHDNNGFESSHSRFRCSSPAGSVAQHAFLLQSSKPTKSTGFTPTFNYLRPKGTMD